jgi:hypothetical protein
VASSSALKELPVLAKIGNIQQILENRMHTVSQTQPELVFKNPTVLAAQFPKIVWEFIPWTFWELPKSPNLPVWKVPANDL